MKVALIGYGYWGKIVERYIIESGMELQYIYCLEHIEDKRIIDNLDIIWKDKAISAVFICTPVSTHFEICKAAIIAGKHVFCEKPTVKSVQELTELQKYVQHSGTVLYTDYIYTTSPSIRYIKNCINKIGCIKYIDANIEQFGNFYQDADVYEVLGVHMISAIYYITDLHMRNCKYEHGFSAQLPLAGKIKYNLENDASVCINCSLIANEKIRKIQFIGEKGSIIFNMNVKPSVVIRMWRQVGNSIQTIQVEDKNFDETQGLFHAMKEFTSVIKEKSKISNIDIAKEVQSVLEKRGEKQK